MAVYFPLAKLRERAAERGLRIGSTAATPDRSHGERFLQWVARGCHGSMEWLGRRVERRIDPQQVLPEAQSIVSFGQSYFTGTLPEPELDQPRGRIARYALGEDYHDTLLTSIRAVAEILEDPLARPYVDTGPVLEKAIAQRAGLGWSGKHTNSVSKADGSYWFIGEVLTTQSVELSEPHQDHCGTCTRCLDVCPTGAIRPDAPYELDARLCISYLTIELRGPIPRALRPLVGQWIFGCDLCLDVCPWNRFAQPTAELRYRPREELLNPPLIEMLSWDQATFSRVMKGSSIKRTKRRGLLRNVAVALGNAGDRNAIPALATCLQTEAEPLIRGHAAWALGELGGPEAQQALEMAIEDPDTFVAEEVQTALDRCGQNTSSPPAPPRSG